MEITRLKSLCWPQFLYFLVCSNFILSSSFDSVLRFARPNPPVLTHFHVQVPEVTANKLADSPEVCNVTKWYLITIKRISP
jgi:hypothetical protein